MTTAAPNATKTYDLSFAKWVYGNINGGDKLSLCMQCGACSGSCPIGVQMDYGPRKLFMMIRAGMKEDVLSANTQWNCTSCYRCVVRCPRGVPVTYILQDLAAKSAEFGYAKGPHENRNFAQTFWWSAKTFGRTDERLLAVGYYFSLGLREGYKRTMANLKTALGMVKTGRLHIGAPHMVKDRKGLKAILAKAHEIEERH
ncbi:MAG: 4Fe-4S dicluster domain-containing protein [Beijerinckiaceae bacterium]